jgi:hypothetical protein
VTSLVEMILLWYNHLTPEYLRDVAMLATWLVAGTV